MLFNRQKPRRFQYEPRYYDPRTDGDRSARADDPNKRSRRLSQPTGMRLIIMALLLFAILLIVVSGR